MRRSVFFLGVLLIVSVIRRWTRDLPLGEERDGPLINERFDRGDSGSATGAGFDRLTETYCIGGVAPPPTGPCPPPGGGGPTQDVVTIAPGRISPQTRHDVSPNVVQIASAIKTEANDTKWEATGRPRRLHRYFSRAQ